MGSCALVYRTRLQTQRWVMWIAGPPISAWTAGTFDAYCSTCYFSAIS
jgi:hypothetical protein